jgi:phenylalanyl-tRNA synthetase beta chain
VAEEQQDGDLEMPITTVSLSDLSGLVGRELDGKNLRSAILGAKGEVEGVDGDEVKLEIKDSNRLDLLSPEGIARTLRGFLGIEKGLPKYSSRPSGIDVLVDERVKDVRPFVVACSARGVELSEDTLVSYMNLQEKIHATYGRGRRRMAIGFYDLDLIKPPIRYILTDPDQNAFVPLGFEEEMTPRRILAEHPKGRDYAHLLEGFAGYPMLLDSEGQVLSMPPIINSSTLGRVTPETRNLFVEATGSDFGVLSLGLNVLATALADRGGQIGSVRLVYGQGDLRKTPDFSTKTMELRPESCNRLLGLEMSTGQMVDLLARARFQARMVGKDIKVTIPPYRGDMMHQADLVEEIAIMYGYDMMGPVDPKIPTVGRTDALEDFSDMLRELMIGMGFQEVMTFVLTSPENVSTKMGGRKIQCVEIENPSTQTFSVFRPDLAPSILEFLGHNAHVSYPQKIFEVGDAVAVVRGSCATQRRLSLAWADSRVNLTHLKGLVDYLMASIGVKCAVEPRDSAQFIPGRAAVVKAGRKLAGCFGEIHPEVLTAWQIPVPVLVAEFLVDPLRSAGPA